MKLIVGAYYQALSLIHTCADSAVEGCVPQWKNRKFPISALTQSTEESAAVSVNGQLLSTCRWCIVVYPIAFGRGLIS